MLLTTIAGDAKAMGTLNVSVSVRLHLPSLSSPLKFNRWSPTVSPVIFTDTNWLATLFHRLDLDYWATRENLFLYLAEERTLWAASLRSKEKDDRRGALVIPDYQAFHRPAEEDEFLRTRQQDLDTLAEKIRQKGLLVP